MSYSDSSLRVLWSSELREAMKARELARISALRAALDALDNAGAVELSEEPSNTEIRQFGVAENEVPRRTLDLEEVAELLAKLASERLSAARQYELVDRPEEADRLRLEAGEVDRLAGKLKAGREP